MKPGVYAGLSNAEYHGGPGISKSGLDLIHRSPMHYHAVVTAVNDNHESTPAQALGTAAHALILEPAEFVKDYCLGLRQSDVPHAIDDRDQLVAMVAKLNETRLPKLTTGGSKAEQIERIMAAEKLICDEHPAALSLEQGQLEAMKGAELKAHLDQLNTHRAGLLSTSGSRHDLAELLRANGVEVTLWSDVQAEWLKNNGDRTVLTPEQWDQLHRMRDAVMAHPAAAGVLARGQNMVIDLKTTDDASLEGFSKSIANWRYDVQHPYYLDGLREALRQGSCEPPAEGAAELSAYWIDKETGVLCRCRPDFWRGEPKHFVFIAVEKKPPYAVGVYVLDAESVELGRAVYRHDLQRYAECKANDTWPGYGDKIQTISVPGWHANKNAHLLDAQ